MDGSTLNLHIGTEMADIDANEWDAIAGKKNPFISYAFLAALEAGGAVGGNCGWDAMHLLLRSNDGQLLGAMPHYLKHHSYGEYIFDHGQKYIRRRNDVLGNVALHQAIARHYCAKAGASHPSHSCRQPLRQPPARLKMHS